MSQNTNTEPWDRQLSRIESQLAELDLNKKKRRLEASAASKALNMFLERLSFGQNVMLNRAEWSVIRITASVPQNGSNNISVLLSKGVVYNPNAPFVPATGDFSTVHYDVANDEHVYRPATFAEYMKAMSLLPALIDEFEKKYYKPFTETQADNDGLSSKRENPLATNGTRRVGMETSE